MGALITSIVSLLPAVFGGIWTNNTGVGAAIYFVTLALLFAPYHLWVHNRKEIASLKEEARPKIKIGDICEDSEPGELFADIYYSFEVTNDGLEELECSAQIRAITHNGNRLHSYYLPEALITRQQRLQGRVGRFNLSPGQMKKVEICYLHTSSTPPQILLCLEKHMPQIVLEFDQTYQIDIGVFSGGASVGFSLKLFADAKGISVKRVGEAASLPTRQPCG